MIPETSQIIDACFSYDHSFGLATDEQRNLMMKQAQWWFTAWEHALGEGGMAQHSLLAELREKLVVAEKQADFWREKEAVSRARIAALERILAKAGYCVDCGGLVMPGAITMRMGHAPDCPRGGKG